ncbi:GRAM domain-containing protein [Halobacillus faecis]
MSGEYEYEGAADLFKGVEAVGGKLYLTRNALIHRPHKVNIQSEETMIELKDIAEVTIRNTWHIIPNGIIVKTTDSKKYRFVLYKRKIWMEKINSLRKQD